MRKFTTLVVNVLLYLDNLIFIEINYIHMSKLSINSKFHLFDVVSFEILDFEGKMYEEVDHLSVLCPPCNPVHIRE